MTTRQSTPEKTYICPTCSSEVSVARAQCPWCQTANPALVLRNGATDHGATATYNYPVTNGKGPRSVITDDPTLTLHRAPAAPPTPVRRGGGRGRMGVAILLALIIFLGAMATGALQGYNDRNVRRTEAAIAAYARGQELLAAGDYDLAAAYFREAVNQEPDFAAAQQLLAVAEQSEQSQPTVPDQPIPTEPPLAVAPTATTALAEVVSNDNASATAFNAGVEALRAANWSEAIRLFENLQRTDPTYQPDEVRQGLFEAHAGMGRDALTDENLAGALSAFDAALQIAPNDSQILELRRLTTNYRNGVAAFDSGAWTRATDQLRPVYLIDRDFLRTETLLAQAHANLGEAFAEREIWCEAAQNYRAANTVQATTAWAQAAQSNDRRCAVRSSATPAPRSTPTTRPGSTAGTGGIGTTPSPTITLTGTLTLPLTATVTPRPQPTVPPPPPPTATSVPAVTQFSLVGGISENLGEGCAGRYVFGTVYGTAGSPVTGVLIVLIDAYSNRFEVFTKDNPIGVYDFPISPDSPSYTIQVFSGGTPLSPPYRITQTDAARQSSVACYTVNWQQNY